MTKEDIKNFEINARNILEKQGAIGFNKFINNFFSQNLCIPKGENRHPYADVLHALAEDITLEVQLCYGQQQWTKPTGLYEASFRIKPQDAVYECMYYDKNSKSDWLTDDEFVLMMKHEPMECYKAYETKRIRT